MSGLKKERKDIKNTVCDGRIIIRRNGLEPRSAKANWSIWKTARECNADELEALIRLYNSKKKNLDLSPTEQRGLRRDIGILTDAKEILRLQEQEDFKDGFEEVGVDATGRVSYSYGNFRYESEHAYYEEDEFGNDRCGTFSEESDTSQKSTIYEDIEEDIKPKNRLSNSEVYKDWNYELDIKPSSSSVDYE